MAGIDNNTVLYLRGDSFNNLSNSPVSIVNNNAIIDNDSIDCSNKTFRIVNHDYLNFKDTGFTIEFDIIILSKFGAWGKIFDKGSKPNYSITQYKIQYYNSYYHFIVGDGSINSNTSAIELPESYIGINTWKHIEISYNRQLNKIYLFVDGKLFTSKEINFVIQNLISTGDICIGYQIGESSSASFKIKNFRISNICRHTSDFIPPSRPYNSITINKTNQTDTNIEFNVEKLGQETINKVEVLVNGTVSETYTDNYDNINYLIDKELCSIGNNNITIRVTFDDIYTEELSLTHKVIVDELPLETPLLDTVERVKLLTKSKQYEKNMLSSILTSKNVEVSEEDKMSDLIGKVDLLGEYDNPILYLYKDGDNLKNISKVAKNENGNGVISVSFDNECIKIINNENSSSGATSNNALSIGINSKIDISKYTKIKCEFTSIVNNYNTGKTSIILLSSSNYTYNTWQEDYVGVFSKYKKQLGNETKAIVECDITNINELSYISVNVVGNTSLRSASVSIHKIWLEK